MKLSYLVLVGSLSMLAVACSAQGSAVGDASSAEKVEEVKEAEDTDAQSESDVAREKTEETTSPETSIERQVLLEQDGLTITATGLDAGGSIWGPEIKLLIENDTEKNLTVQARNVSVNGYMVGVTMSSDVASGKKTNDSLTIESGSLDACNIDDIAYIDLSFHIFDNETWDDLINTEMIHIDTSCADSYIQAYDDSGEVVYDNDGITIVSKGVAEDASFLGPSLILYVENDTENAITVQAHDVSVNGFMVDPIFSCDVMPGKKAIDDMTIMDPDVEENQIENIEEMELSFHIFQADTYETIQDTDPIKITLE